MTRSWLAAVACLIVATSPAIADDPPSEKLNRRIERLTLTGPDGRPFAVGTAPNRKATAVVFLSFECPVSNASIDTLNTLAKQFADRGAVLYGVATGDVSANGVRKWKAEYRIAFDLFTDPGSTAADALKATTTPEAFVLDHNLVLRYRGRIDDTFSARLKRNPSVTTHNLRDALEAVVSGQDVKVPVTTPVGCPLGSRELTAKPGADSNVSYHRDVATILQKYCQGCHRPGQVGPFSLTTYRQAVNWAEDIKEFTHTRKMPPWKPVGGPGYANERRIAEHEIATLARWVDAGCPEGDSRDAPPPVTYSDDWQLGPPDLILTPSAEFHVGPAGPDLFRCFVIPTGLTEDRHVVAYEVKPGNPRVVHHVLNFFDATGAGRNLEAKEQARTKGKSGDDHGPGYSSAMGVGFIAERSSPPKFGPLGGWAPGQLAARLPDGAAFFLPAGSDFIVQTHYHRTGKPETDRITIGLYFAKKPVEKTWQTFALAGMDPTNLIPPGRKDYRATGTRWVLDDAILHSVIGHMHLIGKTITVTMTPPGGPPVTLLDIPDWDYNWQESYWFRQPIKVKAGTRFDVTGVFDNSKDNPSNPFRPPQWIRFGEQTTNEMLFAFIGLTPDGPTRVRLSRTDPNRPADKK
jgi:peroxiredoxin